jgi:DNA invertase Pin-like site-specific DNA recombinase
MASSKPDFKPDSNKPESMAEQMARFNYRTTTYWSKDSRNKWQRDRRAKLRRIPCEDGVLAALQTKIEATRLKMQKLSHDQVREIRSKHAAGIPISKLVVEFKVSRACLYRVINRIGYKSVI